MNLNSAFISVVSGVVFKLEFIGIVVWEEEEMDVEVEMEVEGEGEEKGEGEELKVKGEREILDTFLLVE